MDNLDLTPTGQSYFDNQRAEHQRIIKNGRKLMEEQEKKPNKLTEAPDIVLNEVKKLEASTKYDTKRKSKRISKKIY